VFENHNQPRIPLNQNYYDLTDKSTMEWQAGLMKQYGIDGMCFYHYWFKDGKKILEKPAENLLKWKDIDMPFCFSWANETWARTWSNIEKKNVWSYKFENETAVQENGILLMQEYGTEQHWKDHFEYLLPFFCDTRYIKQDNSPVFMIYEPTDADCMNEMCDKWNEWAKEAGFNGIYFIGAGCSSENYGCMNEDYYHEPKRTIRKMKYMAGNEKMPAMLDYDAVWRAILSADANNSKTCFGGFTGFDLTPRQGVNGIIIDGASPQKFKIYLAELMAKNEAYGNDITFINAWNEWGEGMYLEPDEENGYAYLEAVSYAKDHYQEYISYYKRKRELNVQGTWKRYDMIETQMKRLVPRARIFDKWLSLKEDGINISRYFEEKEIRSVAIYGMGQLGRHLLCDLKQSNVSVEYVIDRRRSIIDIDLEVYDLDGAPISVDAVVVALDYEYENVMKRLEERGFQKVLLLEKIIDNL